MSKGLPSLKDAVELSPLASKIYRFLDPQEYVGKLAPSLGLLLQKDLEISDVTVSEEFLDPKDFISMTHFRESLVDALRIINTSLQRTSDSIPAIPLTHAMGLGKTHFLTLLYHLYTSVPTIWNHIEEELPEVVGLLTKSANYKMDVAKKTLVIAIDLKKIPIGISPYDALFLIIERIFEKYKERHFSNEISKARLEKFKKDLRELRKHDPVDAARKFIEAMSELAISIPVLIIVDEIYAAVYEAAEGASDEYAESVKKVLLFLTSLAEGLRGINPAVLVYASAIQDVLRWREMTGDDPKKKELKRATSFFEERLGRTSIAGLKDVSEEEAFEIVKKRVVRLKAPLDDILTVEKLRELWSSLSQIVGEDIAAGFVKELRATYPFSPIYRELVRKLMSPATSSDFDPGKMQHLRDLIKISSSVLGRILEAGEEAYLISIAHVMHDDIKHLLDVNIANEWSRNVSSWKEFSKILESETRDRNLALIVRNAISSIYIKSVTTNPWDLISIMTKNPKTLTLDELDRRALSQKKLLLSLVGAVNMDSLKKYPEALEKLSTAPYIHIVDQNEEKYYYSSLFESPYQLLRNIQENELRRLRNERGELDVKEAVEYFKKSLDEYRLVSEPESRDIKVKLIEINKFGEDAGFIEDLDRNRFTLLVVRPQDMVDKVIVERRPFNEILEEIRSSIEKSRNKIGYLNMFAVAVPNIDKETLERLISSLTEIKASETVVKILSSERDIEKLVDDAAKRHKSLLDHVKKPEEEFRRIVMEIIARFREKLEIYAQQLSNSAVQNFTTDFVGLFRNIIAYDPSMGKVQIYSLSVSIPGEREQKLDKVFASLPVWIASAARGKLQIAGASEIKARLTEWIKGIINTEIVKKSLRENKEHRFSKSSIVEGLLKGWSEVPIKPESRDIIERAIESLPGIIGGIDPIVIDGREFNLVEVTIEKGDLVIKPREKEIVQRTTQTRSQGIKGFETTNIDISTIILASIAGRNDKYRHQELADLVKMISVGITVGSHTEISIKGSLNYVSELTRSLVQYLNRHRNDISSCKTEVLLTKVITKDEMSKLLKMMGLALDKVKLLESEN